MEAAMRDNETNPAPDVSVPPIRRSVLKGMAGVAGLAAAAPAVLAACSSSGSGDKKSSGAPAATTGGGSTGGSISFGSNYSDPTPKDAFAALCQQATGK